MANRKIESASHEATRVLRMTLPTRRHQRRYERELVTYLVERGLGVKKIQLALGFSKQKIRELMEEGAEE